MQPQFTCYTFVSYCIEVVVVYSKTVQLGKVYLLLHACMRVLRIRIVKGGNTIHVYAQYCMCDRLDECNAYHPGVV